MIFSLKRYLYDVMNDKKNRAVLVKFCLLILSYIYGFLVTCHNFFYKVNLLKSHKPATLVLSVGNITLGGTGKTPFVIMLAERLVQNRRKPAVLIRGYGQDEYKMLQDRLSEHNIKVFVGRDRVKSARVAENKGVETLILDDGFQHRRLGRDLDIVLVDSTNAFGNRQLFPRGILREPITGLRRADIIVLTKVDTSTALSINPERSRRVDKRKGSVEDEIRRIAPGKTIIKARHKPKNLFDIWKGSVKDLTFVNGKTVCILSAICDPFYFRHIVKQNGASIGLEFVFPDHFLYRKCDLNHIFKECESKEIDTIITTEKDGVKLKELMPGLGENPLQILALRVEFEITEGIDELDDKIHRLHMRTSRQDT